MFDGRIGERSRHVGDKQADGKVFGSWTKTRSRLNEQHQWIDGTSCSMRLTVRSANNLKLS